MADISKYTSLIPSQHQSAPKYMAMITLWSQMFVDVQDLLLSLPDEFDLDEAVGEQLDSVGIYVGYSRNVEAPIPSVYFSFDTPGLGWDQGVIFGPFDPTEGLTSLDDETYRTMLRLKIAANSWRGDLPTAATLLANVFSVSGHECLCRRRAGYDDDCRYRRNYPQCFDTRSDQGRVIFLEASWG